MPRDKNFTSWRPSGQALIEGLVGVAALSVFGGLAVMLGKYALVQQTVHGASFALAFECTVKPDTCQASAPAQASADRVRNAYFADGPGSLNHAAVFTTRTGAPLIQSHSEDIAIALTHPHFGAGIGVLSSGARSAAGSAVHVVSNLAGPGRFGFDIAGGLVTAHARATVLRSASAYGAGPGQPDLLDGLQLTLSSRSAVLTDSWNASSPYGSAESSVHSRVLQGQQLAPWIERAQRTAYAPTLGFVRLMGSISLEDTADEFRYHETDVDTISPDRLGQ